MRIVVVLPAPLGPRNPVTVPGSQRNVTSETMVRPPSCLVSPSVSIMPTDSWPAGFAATVRGLRSPGLAAVAASYRALRGREGLGGGDAKLLAASGAWLGAAALPQVILFAALGALAHAAVQRLAGKRLGRHSAMPFGPFLAVATWFLWLAGSVD